MEKKILVMALAVVLLNLACYAPVAAATPADEAKHAAKVKAAIAKLGTGPEARVEVRLRDKTKLKGYVSEISDEQFVVINAQTGAATPVAYPQVKKVKGNNLSTGAKIAIGVGVVAAVFLVIYILLRTGTIQDD